jgi:hypothetical protein
MANLFPPFFDSSTRSNAERRFYEAIQRELGDDWYAFHQVRWIGRDDLGRPSDGEADFVIAHPQYGILIVEVKGGRIDFDPMTGRYKSTDRNGHTHDIGDPFQQAAGSKYTLISKLRAQRDWPPRRVIFGHAVAFIDGVCDASWLRPNAPREIIIDALDLAILEKHLIGILRFWLGTEPRDSAPGKQSIAILTRILAQAEHIRNPLLSDQARNDERVLVKLTENQYRYLRFLSGQRRAVLAGCAGSGKTFLALQKASSLAEDEGLKVLFTCYNRPLADYLGNDLGYRKKLDVFNFHQLCIFWAKEAKVPLSVSSEQNQDYYDSNLPNALMDAVSKLGGQYDAIIVDEGQDFRSEWWEVLPWLLRDPVNGILYIFYDNNQRVYKGRSTIPIPGSPYILDENCRNTRSIFDVVQRFYSGSERIISLGPNGLPVEIIEYSSVHEGEETLRRLLHRLTKQAGFRPEEIAVLSALGKERSGVLNRRFGNYILLDRTALNSGEIFATTVRRFKGLERPVIVLCEVDGRISPEEAESLLYVGTSRAKTYLVILYGEDCPKSVKGVLNSITPP